MRAETFAKCKRQIEQVRRFHRCRDTLNAIAGSTSLLPAKRITAHRCCSATSPITVNSIVCLPALVIALDRFGECDHRIEAKHIHVTRQQHLSRLRCDRSFQFVTRSFGTPLWTTPNSFRNVCS